MSAVLLFDDAAPDAPTRFAPVVLQGAGASVEKPIQAVVHDHPELIPIEEIDPGAGQVVALCRELTLQSFGGPVFLDMLGVTRRGRLVLVECKLWRNPEARRKVIGQILEYAGLMHRLSYGDLSEMIRRKLRRTGGNVIWSLAKDALGLADEAEARFVDAVSQSLGDGAFDLVILGDGIRGELEAIRGYMEAASGLRSRLSLVELTAFRDGDGRTLYVPKVALKTKVVTHRTFDAGAFAPAGLGGFEATADASPGSPQRDEARAGQSVARQENKRFWQAFIDRAAFTHSDQPKPTHGGNNYVRIALPVTSLVAYRAAAKRGANSELGFTLRFPGEEGRGAFDQLRDQLSEIEEEVGQALTAGPSPHEDAYDFALKADDTVGLDEESQLNWLIPTADRLVQALRPRLALLDIDRADT